MISIIIPVYNAEKYLSDMLDSVLRQSYKDIELILINDGSSDSSGAICHAYAENNTCIHVYDCKNYGVSAARNFGITKASGDFVWLMDSDDILWENALQTAVDAQLRSNADIVIGGMEMYFAREGRSERKSIESELTFLYKDFSQYYAVLFNKNYISSLWNKLIRREVIIQYGLHLQENLSMYEDYIFAMDVINKSTILTCVPNILYRYIIRDNPSLSRSHKQNIYIMFCVLKKKITEYMEILGKKQRTAWVSLNNLMIYLAYECVKNEWKAPQKSHQKMKILMSETEFYTAMKQFRGYGLRYRIVHILMRYRLESILSLYFKYYVRDNG